MASARRSRAAVQPPRTSPKEAATSAPRPVWARMLDSTADVLLGVGVTVAVVLLLAAAVAALELADTAAGGWLVGTGSGLVGPLAAVADQVSFQQAHHELAATLGAAAVLWALGGWLLSRLVRPG